MNRLIIQQTFFSRELDTLIEDNKLLISDYEDFESRLLKNPDQGDVIPGTGVIRKARLKSASKGKRGGFRVDYLDIPDSGILHLIVIYGKNVKEDLSQEEKRFFLL